MEPLGGIEPPTFALPRRRYTPKPQWQWRGHQWTRFNHCGFSSEERVQMQQAQVGDIARRPTLPRSHSLVLRKTGNLVGFSLGSSNLPLGATTRYPPATTLNAARALCGVSICHDRGRRR